MVLESHFWMNISKISIVIVYLFLELGVMWPITQLLFVLWDLYISKCEVFVGAWY